jgi:hypothetical protein
MTNIVSFVLKYVDPWVYVVMSALYFTSQSYLGWFITSDSITSCGGAVSLGIYQGTKATFVILPFLISLIRIHSLI